MVTPQVFIQSQKLEPPDKIPSFNLSQRERSILKLYLSDLFQGMFWKLTKGRLCFNEYMKQKESAKKFLHNTENSRLILCCIMHLGHGHFCIDHGMLQSETFLQSTWLITRIFFHTINDNLTKTNSAKKDTQENKNGCRKFPLNLKWL